MASKTRKIHAQGLIDDQHESRSVDSRGQSHLSGLFRCALLSPGFVRLGSGGHASTRVFGDGVSSSVGRNFAESPTGVIGRGTGVIRPFIAAMFARSKQTLGLTVRRSTEFCIDLPDDFPELELTQYMAFARRILLEPAKSAAWGEFGGASNLIAWRYRASYEDWQYYRTSLSQHSNPDHEELYRRERALFGMFSAGVSCIESTVYSLAALASHPAAVAIPFGVIEQRRCNPVNLRAWLAPHPHASGVVAALDHLLAAGEWGTWVELRNRMTHRSNLPRIISVWVGPPPPPSKPIRFAATSSTSPVEAEVADFDALHRWLAQTLALLLATGLTLS